MTVDGGIQAPSQRSHGLILTTVLGSSRVHSLFDGREVTFPGSQSWEVVRQGLVP